jgi:hypothetical protein
MSKPVPKRWVEKGPLAVWMTEYVQWLISQPGAELTGSKGAYRARHPLVTERAAMASKCSGRRVQVPLIPLLERRQDLRDYYERLRADTQFHSKELARGQIAENFQARAEGLQMAREAKDYSQIRHYTEPFVAHALPKMKVERQESAPRIVIQIGSAEAKKMIDKALSEEEEPQEVEYEIIETKLLEDGEDD